MSRDCSTAEGSTATHTCRDCGGHGHYARECPTSHEELRSKRPPKGQGKGDKAGKGGKGKNGKGQMFAIDAWYNGGGDTTGGNWEQPQQSTAANTGWGAAPGGCSSVQPAQRTPAPTAPNRRSMNMLMVKRPQIERATLGIGGDHTTCGAQSREGELEVRLSDNISSASGTEGSGIASEAGGHFEVPSWVLQSRDVNRGGTVDISQFNTGHDRGRDRESRRITSSVQDVSVVAQSSCVQDVSVAAQSSS